MEYKKTGEFTIIRGDLQKFVKEAERLGSALYELYRDSDKSIINVTIKPEVRDINSNLVSTFNYDPIYTFLVMPNKGVDVSINFNDVSHRFVMKWG